MAEGQHPPSPSLSPHRIRLLHMRLCPAADSWIPAASPQLQCAPALPPSAHGRQAGRQAGRQGGRQALYKAGRQAGKQVNRQQNRCIARLAHRKQACSLQAHTLSRTKQLVCLCMRLCKAHTCWNHGGLPVHVFPRKKSQRGYAAAVPESHHSMTLSKMLRGSPYSAYP
eukprot:1142134-Pelagomonas_calceolata.AAC.1